MQKRRHKNPKEEAPVAGTQAGRRLLHYIRRHGEQNIATAIGEIRQSIPSEFKEQEPCTRGMAAEDLLERMYHDYVASSRGPLLTFIEYKALVDIIADLP